MYLIPEDVSGKLEEMRKADIADYGDPDAPGVTADGLTRTSNTAATASFSTNEAGTAYYLVLDWNAPAPTGAAVKAGTLIGTMSEGDHTANIVLTAGPKRVYIVVEDAAGNISAPAKFDAWTYGETQTDMVLPNPAVQIWYRNPTTVQPRIYMYYEAGWLYAQSAYDPALDPEDVGKWTVQNGHEDYSIPVTGDAG